VIYLDGWQFHAQIVADDLALRQKLIRSGHLHVWSATWDDVAGASEGSELRHYWSPIAKVSLALQRLSGGEDLARDTQDFLDASPFDQFMIYLGDPNADKMARRARCVAMSGFAVGREAGKNREVALETVERFAGHGALDTLAATQSSAAWGRVGANDSGVLVAAIPQTWAPPAWPAIEDITVVFGFEHRLTESREAKKCWNGALRLMNLIQFCPYFYVGCAESVEPPPAFRIEGASGDEAWLEIERDVLGELADLVRRLRQGGVPVPAFIHEAVGQEGEVLGAFELAWPDRLIGVVADVSLLQAFPGWTVFAPGANPDMIEKTDGETAVNGRRPEIHIMLDFMAAQSKLPRAVQSKTSKLILQLKSDPSAHGINWESIEGAKDRHMKSARVDLHHRAIVYERGGVLVLLWVDKHDDAYRWARRPCLR